MVCGDNNLKNEEAIDTMDRLNATCSRADGSCVVKFGGARDASPWRTPREEN
jgi:hypothetical protein